MQFDWKPALESFLEFGDELVININKSEDQTEKLIFEWAEKAKLENPTKEIKVVSTDFSYTDPRLDGKCKNSAVQHCSKQFIILIDIDEKLIISHRPQWERLALDFIQKDKCFH